MSKLVKLEYVQRQLLEKRYAGKFEETLSDTIDEALTSLGESPRRLIYFHLGQDFVIPRQEVPKRVDDFSDVLERTLGLDDRQLEILIMKFSNKEISCQYELEGPNWVVSDLTLKEIVELTRLYFKNRGKVCAEIAKEPLCSFSAF